MKDKPDVVTDKSVKDMRFEDLQELLRLAAKLELFTIPFYFYAYYSLKDQKSHVGVHLREVIMEEMLHMAIISNIMHAIENCKPPAYSPIRELEQGRRYSRELAEKYVPFYPGRAPIYKSFDERSDHRRFVERAPILSLDSLSRTQIVAFLRLELPELRNNLRAEDWETIGEFYNYVKKQMLRCPDLKFRSLDQIDLYTHNPTKERNSMRPVQNLKDALENIDLIMEQGEGATFYNLIKYQENYYHRKNSDEAEKPELAHFYHFLIVYELMGGKEKFNIDSESFDDKRFIDNYDERKYESFRKENVINLVKDPVKEINRYPEGAVEANRRFNLNYSRLLDRLTYASLDDHRLNFGIALEQMSQFDNLAKAVTAFTLKDDKATYCGPTFEYLPPENLIVK